MALLTKVDPLSRKLWIQLFAPPTLDLKTATLLGMRSKYGMVTKMFSAQRYDPIQVSESLIWCAKPHKHFSRPTQSQTVGCVKHNFWQPDSEGKSLKCPKNCVLRTQLFDFEWAEKIFVRFCTSN